MSVYPASAGQSKGGRGGREEGGRVDGKEEGGRVGVEKEGRKEGGMGGGGEREGGTLNY